MFEKIKRNIRGYGFVVRTVEGICDIKLDDDRLTYVMVPGIIGVINKELGLRLIYIDPDRFEGKSESRVRELIDNFAHYTNMKLLQYNLL